ncbi:MAG: polyamine aminopropyltransferase [Candidatus Asgardarchaeum sp.]
MITKNSKWAFEAEVGRFQFIEKSMYGISRLINVSKILYSGETKYQRIDLFESLLFGKVLVLDGLVQFSSYDEYIYHEALVHPTMLSIENPRKVLIIGGGDGGALRQVLKHSIVEKVILVDIDREVIEFSKKYFPTLGKSFDDPRVKVIIDDGRKFIKETTEIFDFIIIDLTDPSGPSRYLYTKEFYQLVKSKLADDGAIVTHAESLYVYQYFFISILRTLSAVFKVTRPYKAYVPSFGFLWGYVTASEIVDPLTISEKEIEKRMHERGVTTKFYYPELHKSLFILPKDVLEAIEKSDAPISTDEKPIELPLIY